ncbi:MAG: hypothetical protein HQM13_23150 [SAR324 cluster bacterium]|nr:hypothetical protein [SAR324 cluster bacterium]
MSNKNANPASIDKEKISRVVKAMLQTPTPENSQPWTIVACDHILEIFHSSERAKLATFPDDLSVFGIGMLVETLELVCSNEGLEAQTTLLLENRSDEAPWLRVELTPVERRPDPLGQAIFLRHTDRRHYAAGSLNDPIFQNVRREGKASQGSNLYFINEYPDEYLQLLRNADQKVMEWDELRHDLMNWTRFTNKAIAETKDGMPWRSFLRESENWVYYLRSRVWWLATCLDWFPDWLQRLETRFFDDSSELSPLSYDDGAGIGCITTMSASEEDLVASGRLTLRIWLLLNMNGYGFQPLSNLSSTIYPLQTGRLNLPKHLAHLVENGYEILQRVFGFSKQETPIFCFRTGVAKGEYPENARSLRRVNEMTFKKNLEQREVHAL